MGLFFRPKKSHLLRKGIRIVSAVDASLNLRIKIPCSGSGFWPAADHGKAVNFAKSLYMGLDLDELLTVTFTLFAVIDIVGSVPLLLALKKAGWNPGIESDPGIRWVDGDLFISWRKIIGHPRGG